MLDLIKKNFSQPKKKLEQILSPIKEDLSLLESNLTQRLNSGNPDLDRMINYFFNSGGKRLRPAIIMLLGKTLNKGTLSKEIFELAEAIEMIHTATLIHDDVIDGADTRRGFLTINKKWGVKSAVIAGDYILSRSLTKLVNIGTIAVEMFAGTLNELCIGEISQKNQKNQIISIDDYLTKSERKTAKLFMASAECLASITPDSNNLMIKAAREYSLNYGLAFQIVDDILNFTQSQLTTGKPAGIDLKNGIITAPVIFAVQEYEQKGDNTLRKLIESGFTYDKNLKKALKLISESNGIEKSNKLAKEFTQKSIDSLTNIEDSIYKDALIQLASYTTERTS